MNSPSEQLHIRRQRKDKFARFLFGGFGGLVLLTLVILIVHLLSQALPLALKPTIEAVRSFDVARPHRILAAGDVMTGQTLITAGSDCRLTLYSLAQRNLSPYRDYVRPCNHALGTVTATGKNYLVDVSPAGQVRVIEERSLQPHRQPGLSALPAISDQPVSQFDRVAVSFSVPESRWQAAVDWNIRLSDKWAVMTIEQQQQTFLRWVNIQKPTLRVDQVFPASAQVLPLPGTRQTLVHHEGQLSVVDLTRGEVAARTQQQPVLWWQSLPKDRTVLMLDQQGTLTRWVLQNQQGILNYVPTYSFSLANGEVPVQAVPHASSNALAVLTNQQRLLLLNRITGELVADYQGVAADQGLVWFGQRLYTFSEQSLQVWQVNHLSGITTWSSLFEAQKYEGYPQPDRIWQTTSASDYQEAKYSLVPLLMGSLKASLLALVIAIPVSVGAAVYTAYFATPGIRQWLKPGIEMLEAIPSVLIGFIAAIWLAPLAEPFLFSFAVFIVIVPVVLVVVALFQHRLARKIPLRWRTGSELLFTVLGILLLGSFCLFLAPQWFFAIAGIEDFHQLSAQVGTPIGKNTLVVAVALGIAISPSIYSLAEDAINGVPKDLKLASFALGATRLQTLHRVVLQVAVPGILAAIMLGFGRAFGETMIVLMVTGNTPVASWDLFEGLRALTANLAIELPEADVGSIHYQILFFTACILFAFTFVVNTCAELLRQSLRSRTPYA